MVAVIRAYKKEILEESLQLQAIGTYTNGQTVDLTRQSQWMSSNISTATVNNGLVKGVASGSATITATYGGLTASTAISVDLPALKSIRVAYAWTTPDGKTTYFTDAPEMTTGQTLQFKAFGYYSDDNLRDISKWVAWGSSNTAIATISTKGLATATGKGTTRISATCTGDAFICTQHISGTITGATNLTVTPSPVYLFITSPTDGSTIAKTEATIQGTVITQANEVGITINGKIATVYGNQFIANKVPLTGGNNIITAKAIDSNGAEAEARVIVNVVPAVNYIRLTTNIESGIAPMEATLTIDGTINFTESTLTYAYTGTTPPEITPISSEEYKVKMTAEGIYTFTANVTDAQGQTYIDSITITVLNRDTLDALLKAKWEGMKNSLLGGDIETALIYFVAGSKDKYRQVFTELGNSNINLIFLSINDIELDTLYEGSAECGAIRIETGGVYSYPITFVQDENGIWKIMGF